MKSVIICAKAFNPFRMCRPHRKGAHMTANRFVPNDKSTQSPITEGLELATGPIKYTFLNNYMFISILERNPDILKELVCALLYLENDESISVDVLNPITPADLPEKKTYILDIKVMLNGNTLLNLELQVLNYHDYNYRATQYLCRTYDNILRGEAYLSTIPAIHIGFLDYDLFEDEKEFYAHFLIQNVKTGHVFNDRFDIRIVSMRQVDLATEKDREYGIDKWVRLFKATTWENLKMAATTLNMQNAAENLYKSNRNKAEMYYAQAYEDYIRNEERHERIQAQLTATIADKDATISDQANALAEKDAALAEKDALIARLQAQLKAKN